MHYRSGLIPAKAPHPHVECGLGLAWSLLIVDSTGSGQRSVGMRGRVRFGVYVRSQDDFKLLAYMKLTRLRRNYSVYECHGASEALFAMTPEWSLNHTQ